MYNCTCKSLWIEKASAGKLGVNGLSQPSTQQVTAEIYMAVYI